MCEWVREHKLEVGKREKERDGMREKREAGRRVNA
jgi:hypothetical protein